MIEEENTELAVWQGVDLTAPRKNTLKDLSGPMDAVAELVVSVNEMAGTIKKLSENALSKLEVVSSNEMQIVYKVGAVLLAGYLTTGIIKNISIIGGGKKHGKTD